MVAVESRRPERSRTAPAPEQANGENANNAHANGDHANVEARAKTGETAEAKATRRALDHLATLAVPVLLGALGVVLWSLLTSLVDGVDANRAAIAELQVTIENLAATVSERTADRWTATQAEQQQLIQALVDTAQNDQLIEAKEELRAHRERLEAMALELAIDGRRLDEIEGLLREGE